MPKYDEDVRNAEQTVERYEAEHERRAKEAETCDDKQKRYALLFGNWMLGRRIVSYNRAVECQKKGIHEIVHVVNGVNVCTCGLFDEAGDHFE